jgi:hypothetical protein
MDLGDEQKPAEEAFLPVSIALGFRNWTTNKSEQTGMSVSHRADAFPISQARIPFTTSAGTTPVRR